MNWSEARHWPKRLPYRVTFVALLWLLPTFFGISEDASSTWREVCVAALGVVLAAWVGKQGQRKDITRNGDALKESAREVRHV